MLLGNLPALRLRQGRPGRHTQNPDGGLPGKGPGRADVPLRRPQKRARLEDARVAARPENRDAALEDLQANMVAQTTRKPMESRVRTWVAICGDWGVPWPVSADALRKVGASMRRAQYSSVKLYFQVSYASLVVVTWFMLRDQVRLRRATFPSPFGRSPCRSIPLPLLILRTLCCACGVAVRPLCPVPWAHNEVGLLNDGPGRNTSRVGAMLPTERTPDDGRAAT